MEINNLSKNEAKEYQEELNNIQLKFQTLKNKFQYEKESG